MFSYFFFLNIVICWLLTFFKAKKIFASVMFQNLEIICADDWITLFKGNQCEWYIYDRQTILLSGHMVARIAFSGPNMYPLNWDDININQLTALLLSGRPIPFNGFCWAVLVLVRPQRKSWNHFLDTEIDDEESS